ncbi:type II CRISPR RNA-guided endonuclease Cas9 [Rhodothalassium salexigens DSM 2132]|nr:type II CRISPR RNA-guided endonuclease Cas9 [Rhodothalassium salexigens DSM 2132]
MRERYRLGIDMGSNSIGWCALSVNDRGLVDGLLDAGVRVLSPSEEAGRDPQSKVSLAADRRLARSARKRRDRFIRRRDRLMETLIGAGLMPTDKTARKALEKLDPYTLRAEALKRPLAPEELGRALFHLNQRRGFKSNRIADAGEKEAGAVKAGADRLVEALEKAGAETLGAYLAGRHGRNLQGECLKNADCQPVRFRPRREGAKDVYDFYPTRDLVEQEIDTIWCKQSPHLPQLSDSLKARIKRIILGQRPLKKPLVGNCTFNPKEKRAPRALPLFQRYRLLTETANLRVEEAGRPERPLSNDQQRLILGLLSTRSGEVSFEAMRKALKLPEGAAFNLERGGRKGLDPDLTAAKLAHKDLFGKAWRSFDMAKQNDIVHRLLTEEDEAKLLDFLQDDCGLSADRAERVNEAHLPSVHGHKAHLPSGHGHIGETMLARLVEVLENNTQDWEDPQSGEIITAPITYDEAVQRLDAHHSDMRPAATHDRLPYYGDVLPRHVIQKPDANKASQDYRGRVPNPTVHIAMNQLRQIINMLISVYGPPDSINIELARQLKQTQEQKDEWTRKNKKNERERINRRQRLADLGIADTPGNMQLMRLYDELPPDQRVCVYSNTPLSMEMIVSGEVEIDHILPRSKTLDDSFANKVLCTRQANRDKGNRAPADAFSVNQLTEIHARAKTILPRKAWRFAPDAMDRFEAQGGFLAKQLTDSQHMARLAKEYLSHICAADKVTASPGRLTALLRGKWGLNSLLYDHNLYGPDDTPPKQREDHRHHAIDAFVIGCTTRFMLQRVATAAGRAEELDLDRLAPRGEFPEPFPGYREELKARLEAMIISHKPDHGRQGQLHEETAFGRVDEEIDGKRFNLVTRKPIEGLTEKMVAQVRDPRLRDALVDLVKATKETLAAEACVTGQPLEKRDIEKAIARALADYGKDHNVRRVRVLVTESSTRTVRHGPNREFEKAYVPGSNHRLDIYELPDGTWKGEGISVFDVNQPGFQPRWRAAHPDARLVMALHKGDLFEADFGHGPEILVARKLSPANGRIEFVSHRWAGKMTPQTYRRAAFSKLKAAGAKPVRVDPIGRMRQS